MSEHLPAGWAPERYAEIVARLAKWDSGESVWTLDMGGLGPGYEQAIQVLTIEMLRDALALPLLATDVPAMEKWGDAAAHRTNHNGYSGAQVGAARWLAYRLCVEGWDSLNARAKAKAKEDGETDDRAILCSTMWPTAQVPA